MTQKNIKKYVNEIYTNGPRQNYITNKTNVYNIDDIWSLDIVDLKGYGPESNRNYRYVLVVLDSFSKYDWTVPLKKKRLNNKKVF